MTEDAKPLRTGDVLYATQTMGPGWAIAGPKSIDDVLGWFASQIDGAYDVECVWLSEDGEAPRKVTEAWAYEVVRYKAGEEEDWEDRLSDLMSTPGAEWLSDAEDMFRAYMEDADADADAWHSQQLSCNPTQATHGAGR